MCLVSCPHQEPHTSVQILFFQEKFHSFWPAVDRRFGLFQVSLPFTCHVNSFGKPSPPKNKQTGSARLHLSWKLCVKHCECTSSLEPLCLEMPPLPLWHWKLACYCHKPIFTCYFEASQQAYGQLADSNCQRPHAKCSLIVQVQFSCVWHVFWVSYLSHYENISSTF